MVTIHTTRLLTEAKNLQVILQVEGFSCTIQNVFICQMRNMYSADRDMNAIIHCVAWHVSL